MSIRRRRRNKGKQRAGTTVAAAPLPRVRQGPVEIPAENPGRLSPSPTPPDTVSQGPDYAYVKRDMIWMLVVSAVLFGVMILIAPFL